MKIAIGTAQFGLDYGATNSDGQVTTEKISQILNLAHSRSISMIDTAIAYGNAHKQISSSSAKLKDFSVVTKLPSLSNGNNVNELFTTALADLKLKSVYGLLFHDSKDLLGEYGKTYLKKVLDLKSSNKIIKIGVSVYDEQQIDSVLKVFTPDIIQVPVNMIDQRLIKSNSLKKLKSLGVEIHARSVFLQGILLSETKQLPSVVSKYADQLKRVRQLVLENGMTPIGACLSFINSVPEIDYAVLGFTDKKQLEELIDNLDELSDFNSNFWSQMSIDSEGLLNPALWGQ